MSSTQPARVHRLPHVFQALIETAKEISYAQNIRTETVWKQKQIPNRENPATALVPSLALATGVVLAFEGVPLCYGPHL